MASALWAEKCPFVGVEGEVGDLEVLPLTVRK